ncbi:MAG: hypothetical protein ACJAS1_001900 [Oleiphilaceae bacterium]|jgi:hypothetical protein
MSFKLKTIFKVTMSKVSYNNNSYDWRDPDGMNREKIKGELTDIARQLTGHVKETIPDEKISFLVTNTMPVEEPTVSLAINMQGTLNLITAEQWANLGNDITKMLTGLISKVNKLAELNTLTFPEIIVEDAQQLNLISEEVSDTSILVSSEREKAILKPVINLAQSNQSINYEINGVQSSLKIVPEGVTVKKAGPTVVRNVYVTYFDFLKPKFGIYRTLDAVRMVEVSCTGPEQEEKLQKAYELKCEAQVMFATEIKTNGKGKIEEKLTEIIEVLEIYEDRRCPVQIKFI